MVQMTILHGWTYCACGQIAVAVVLRMWPYCAGCYICIGGHTAQVREYSVVGPAPEDSVQKRPPDSVVSENGLGTGEPPHMDSRWPAASANGHVSQQGPDPHMQHGAPVQSEVAARAMPVSPGNREHEVAVAHPSVQLEQWLDICLDELEGRQ